LLNEHEELSIDLVLRDDIADMIEEGLDLQVLVGAANDSALISRRVGATPALLVAAPQYLKERSLPEQPSDLRHHDCIVYRRWGGGTTCGGSRLPRAMCRFRCVADFEPTRPRMFRKSSLTTNCPTLKVGQLCRFKSVSSLVPSGQILCGVSPIAARVPAVPRC
jgi:hypothetical protein